jgi:hypothetical protein
MNRVTSVLSASPQAVRLSLFLRTGSRMLRISLTCARQLKAGNHLFTIGAHQRARGALAMSDSDIRPDGQPERRRVPRTALRLNASIREPGRSRTGARVIDISTHGCRIETTPGASADSWILLSIAGLETQYCRVAWSCHEFAGVEFATPLAEPVLDRLLQDHSQLSETAIGELRSIASRAHRLSAQEDGERRTLAELSRKCAVDAVVEGLRLGEAKQAKR